MEKISNNEFTVKIKKAGAELVSVVANNHEYIWNADPTYWARHAPVLFPIVGALKNGSYSVDEKVYHLGQHGFARDKEFVVIDQTSNSITYKISDTEDTRKVYPYKFSLEIKYTLNDNQLDVEYQVTNLDSQVIYFSIGAHPGFNISNIDTCSLLIPDDYDTYSLDNGFIGKKSSSVSGDIKCSNEFFAKGAFIYEPKGCKKITLLENGCKYVSIEYDDFKLMGVWTPEDRKAPFICLEPWNGIADFNAQEKQELKDKEFIETLAVGHKKSFKYKIKFYKKEK